MERNMTHADAVSGIERYLTRGKFAKADVFIAHYRGLRFIVKDFGGRGFWERNLIGRIVIGRESRAYEALAGVEGLPSRFKRLTPFSLAIEYLEGRDLGGVERHEIGPGVIVQFERIINELHERGWVHLDLQRRSNILLVNDKVFVVDLASAFHPGGIPLIGGWMVRALGFADRLSIVKIKSIFAPELLSASERRLRRFRNSVMPNIWTEETVTVRKERKLPHPPPGPGGAGEAWKRMRGESMTVKDTLRYKLTKVTGKTVMAAIVGIVMFFLAKGRQLEPAWFIPGAAITLAGEWLRLWAAGHLRKNKQLTTTGPYSYVKNPLYIGTLLITIGYSAMAMNYWIMAVGFIWFFIYYAPYKKKQENEKLIGSFGAAWTEFDKAVPDYLPRLTPYPGRGTNRWSWEVVKENSEHETAVAVFIGFAVMLYLLVR
ncbi:MAG: methyltransferase [Nitrospirota bacterium]